MADQEFIELLQYRIFRKIEKMQHVERAAFMADLFGKQWTDVYERLTLLYPSLTAPNMGIQGTPKAFPLE